ncbi:PREDICTED: uncharacterized protein LOC109190936 [Ipomoea nil]|uniref:uncharacterized protein LOC109190936 n=1 Tax=Ipomoea nil TaxID=35883 RepID=UPI000900F551|nr:PREDICTED: uncharacterized protein LOC109190936 [Ipomoea nil]
MRRYDGTSDPQENVLTYQAAMMLIGSSDALMCRAFFSTLSGGAQRWFTNLKGGSLGSFQDLATGFITHFLRGRRRKKHFTHLASVKQGENETLTQFLARWRKEEAEVEDMDDRFAMVMFIAALRAGELYKSLRRKAPGSYATLMMKADWYAEAEEANRMKRIEEHGSSKKPQIEEPPCSKKGAGYSQESPEDRKCQLVKTFGPNPVPPGADTTRYCKFHRRYGHATNDCQAWRKEIEFLIQAGKLTNFIDWERLAARNTKRSTVGPAGEAKEKSTDSREGPGKRPVINVIFGGGASRVDGGCYVGAVDEHPPLKRPRREPIWFSDNDLPARETTPKDALVVAMVVNGVCVKRVLVDTGSSVNVMYHDVFVKLGLSEDQLRPVRTPLTGFTGDTIETEGSIVLPVEVGNPPHVKKVDMEFLVVRIVCAHEFILGRPGLAALGGLISMEHLCLKFHTPEGVGTVWGDQHLVQKCYKTACERMLTEELPVHTVEKEAEREKKAGPEPAVELEEIPLDPSRPDKCVRIGKGLAPRLREQVIAVLRKYSMIFA